jgi:hypothetical protein
MCRMTAMMRIILGEYAKKSSRYTGNMWILIL